MEITPAALSALYTKYSQIFQNAFLQQDILWNKVAQLVPSTSESETHVWVDRIPALRKWVGDRVVRNASLRDYVLTNAPYELTEGLDRFKIEDNKIQAFEPVVKMLAAQAKKWPDTLIFDSTLGILATGQNSSAVTYDGQPFFSTAHPQNPDNAASTSQSNYFTATPLSHANFSLVRAAMRAFRGADGLPLKTNPNLLIVPPALEQTGKQILEEEWVSPTAGFGTVAGGAPSKNSLVGTADLLVVDDLAGADDTWYLGDYKKAIKPLLFQLRQPAEFVMRIKPDDPSVFSRHEFQYGVSVRGAAGYGAYFLMAKAVGH
jgi:phage major head subunit gpT-like protein